MRSRCVSSPSGGGDIDRAARAGDARKRQAAGGIAMALTVALVATACGSGGSGPSPAAATAVPPPAQPTAESSPPGVSAVKDIPFASPDGVRLAVDVYRPNGASNPPAVVLVGPGGWGMKSRETMPALAKALAQRGLVVFVGDTRLACDGQSPL